LSEKLNVIHEVEAKSVISWVEIVNHLGLAPSLSRIVLNKNKIIEGEMWSTLKEENEHKAELENSFTRMVSTNAF
jgi:hypothetical protein